MKNLKRAPKVARKPKFQADLAPIEDNTVRSLKAELQLTSNSDFLSEALALFQWAVSERKRGRRIISESENGERQILVLPRLERVAPEAALPRVEIDWTERELESLMKLAGSAPAKPTEALIRALKGWPLATIIRLLEENDSTESFDCGDGGLNNYLKAHAWNNQKKSSIGVTYVAVEEVASRVIIGYFTLATSSIPRDKLPKKSVRGLPAYDLPVILLARLAVDRRFHRHGLGQALLSEALKISLDVSEQVGCRCVIVDAYRTASEWYQRYGFAPIEGGKGITVRMYLDIRTVKMARQPADPERR
jgi:GNAT superfamily N-acetyltransferase